ncbi:MAG: ATP-binding protein [Syntrophobacterales bacterium]|nr:ATP-binding protein [Syntrophobacterales bacterium]
MARNDPQKVFLEPPRPHITYWSYPFWGFFLGTVAGIIVGHPLSMVVRNFDEFMMNQAPLELGHAIIQGFSLHMWPMILLYALSGAIFGVVLGTAYQRLNQNRRRLVILHQEFEIQVATLRHHYKNLTIGIGGFTHRVISKLDEVTGRMANCQETACPYSNQIYQSLIGLRADAAILGDTSQRLTDTLGREVRFLKALTMNCFTLEPQDLYPIIISSIKELKELRFTEKTIKVEINGHSPEKCRDSLIFLFDPYAMEVLVQNILSNAMKIGDFIQVRVADNGDQIIIEVEDNGPGLEVNKLKGQLLTPSDRPEAESTQLGLRVSLQLLDKCGGRLAVQSEPGQGATFSILLPKPPGSR